MSVTTIPNPFSPPGALAPPGATRPSWSGLLQLSLVALAKAAPCRAPTRPIVSNSPAAATAAGAQKLLTDPRGFQNEL